MITRITVNEIKQKSFESSDTKHFGLKIPHAQKMLLDDAARLSTLANLCSYMEFAKDELKGEEAITRIIRVFFPKMEVTVRPYSKTKITYSFIGCTITEEDN